MDKTKAILTSASDTYEVSETIKAAEKKKAFFTYGTLSKYRSELMGIAMLCVMFFHAYDFDFEFEILNTVRSLGFGGVDIFIMLSSMGLVVSLSKRKQEYGEFMSRRISRLFPGYLIVMIPYTVFQILHYGAPWSSLFWNSTLLSYWVRCGGRFNWYITGIMIFYIITPHFFKKFSVSKHREFLTSAWIAVCLLVSQLLMQEGYWNFMDIIYRFAPFILGILMGFYVLSNKRFGVKSMVIHTLSLAAGIFYYFVSVYVSKLEIRLFLPFCHIFIFTTIPVCLFICFLFDKLPLGILRKFFSFIGKNSLEIYLLNVSLFTETKLLRKYILIGFDARIYYLITFMANILLGWGLHKAIELLTKFALKNRKVKAET